MADTPKSKIPPMYANSNFREFYNFVSELNSIMHNDGLTTERAYQKMSDTASEDEKKKYAAMHRILKACGLISESGKVCTKSEFVDEVQKFKLDLLDKQAEKQEAHDKQLKELNQTKSALTNARLKRNWGLFRKWGAVAFGVTAVVAACLLLPAVASVVAGAIGGAASIGAAVGTAIVAGVVGYGAYHFTKWFVKKNFLEGSELVAKFDHKVRELKADKNKENAKYKEAQKELQLVKTQIADISSLEGTFDASDVAKENARAYEYANIDLFNEGERDSYNAVVEQYEAQIADAKTVKDIEDAKKWLVTNTDKFMSKNNETYIRNLITDRTTYKTTAAGDMRTPEATAVATREDERITKLTDLKTTFSRSELEKLKAEIAKAETYPTKEDIEEAIKEESKLFVGSGDITLINAFRIQFASTSGTKVISKDDLTTLVKTVSTEMSKKYWTLDDIVKEYIAKAGTSNVAKYAHVEYVLQLGKKLKGSTKCIEKVAGDKIEDIIKSAIGEVPAISLEEQSKNPAFIAETTIRSHYDPNGVKGLTKATKEKNRQAIEDKIKEFVQKVSKGEPVEDVSDFINREILPNMIKSAGNKIEPPTVAGKTDKKVYSYESYESKGHREFAGIVREDKARGEEEALGLGNYFTTEGELTDDILSEQVKFAMLQLKAEFLRKGEIDPERVKHFVDFAKAHAPVKTPAVERLVDETDDETVDDETKKPKKPGKDSDRIKSGTSEDEEDESDDDRKR